MMTAPPQGCFLRGAVHSRFWAILLLSLALHGGLFVTVLWQRKVSPAALPPIFATLHLVALSESQSESGSALAAAASPARAAPAIPQKARQTPSRNEAVSSRSTISTAGPANSPASNSSTSETVSAAKTAPAETAPLPVAVRSDSELLDNYRRRLGELFARQQEYPRIAALRGWEGEVRLRLKVARKGQLLSVNLDRTSGFDVLDQHALAMLETLASLPPLPEALEANEIQVVVPINYKLKKTT
jgi:protein TonB